MTDTTNTPSAVGEDMHATMCALFPICRSITGDGVRETLRALSEIVPLTVHEVPSGTKAFDWIVPDEWNVRDAYVMDETGNRIIDFHENNLHLVGYSEPFEGSLSLEELKPHLHTHPELPDAIPYVTSYYKRTWGFCLSQSQMDTLSPQTYTVKVDTTLAPGSLTYGEIRLPGTSDKEVLIATNVCHPSMANNELSGPIVTAYAARWVAALPDRRYSYRILFLPETIGAITYLSRHLAEMKEKTIAGYQAICLGGPDDFTYIQTRNGGTLTDRVTQHILKHLAPKARIQEYRWRGSDERQWGSPGADLPVGAITKTVFEGYDEYHTSLDDLSFVTAEHLQRSFTILTSCLTVLEKNYCYRMVQPCEPQLGKRDLWPSFGGRHLTNDEVTQRVLAVLGYCDGSHDLIEIADRHNIPVWDLYELVETFLNHGLLTEVENV